MVGWCVSVVLEGVAGGGGGGVRHGHEHLLECRRAWGSTLERPVRLARLVDRPQSTPGILTACRRVSIAINTIIDCYNSRSINHKSLQFCLEIRNWTHLINIAEKAYSPALNVLNVEDIRVSYEHVDSPER